LRICYRTAVSSLSLSLSLSLPFVCTLSESAADCNEKTQAINEALQLSLELNKYVIYHKQCIFLFFPRPEILELLITKQADMSTIKLYKLYHLPEVEYNIDKLKLASGFSENDNSMDLEDDEEKSQKIDKDRWSVSPHYRRKGRGKGKNHQQKGKKKGKFRRKLASDTIQSNLPST
jgi:hypothetical protein